MTTPADEIPGPAHPAPARERMRHSRALSRAAIAVGGLALAAGIALFVVSAVRPTTPAVPDMRGHAVQLDPGVTPIPATASQAQSNTGARLVISSVGLNVPLGALNAVHGEITPPGFTSAYWVRNKGVAANAAASGTVYVVMHSLRGGGVAPGNYVTDPRDQRSKVAVGASVSVAGVDYTVTGSRLVAKGALASDGTAWANTDNRLLLITCLEHADGSASTDNLIITAMLTASP